MRLAAFLIALTVCAMMVGPGIISSPVFAKDGVVEAKSEFRKFSSSRWQRTDVTVLGPDDPLDLIKSKDRKLPPRDLLDLNFDVWQVISIALLIGAIGVGIYLFLRSPLGGGLLAQKPQDAPLDVEGISIGGLDNTASNSFSLDALSRLEDPRKALHLLLVNALARAAATNRVPVRRSLTARDILHQLPLSWTGRERLEKLVVLAEPVLFGGRSIDDENLKGYIDLARPLFPAREGKA